MSDVGAFVKRAAPGALSGEARGLAALAALGAVRVPRVLESQSQRERDQLVLERLRFERGDGAAWAALGTALARMHRAGAALGSRAGFDAPTWCGALPQDNRWRRSWRAFFVARRLAPQLARANARARQFRDADRALAVVRDSLPRHAPLALLHGDLWCGNVGFVRADNGRLEPVVFDPAAYFGDREADLAMTHFFGGFAPEFYAAYEAEWPLPTGHELRRPMYNLFHALNHYNIFGGAYASQVQTLIDEIVERGSVPPPTYPPEELLNLNLNENENESFDDGTESDDDEPQEDDDGRNFAMFDKYDGELN